MSANIFGKRFYERLGEGREPAWHGIGKSWTGPKTAEEAVAESGVGEVRIGTRRMGWQTEAGEFETIDDRVVIVRYPVPDDLRVVRLGEASIDYTVLQNTDVAQALDASGLTERWSVETCGALGQGETLFICLSMGSGQIAGEDHNRYALIWDKRDGKSSLQVVTCWTRVVCQNTLQVALGERDAEVKINLQHGEHIGTDFRFSLDVINQVEAQSQRVRDALEELHDVRIASEDLPGIWKVTYPEPRKGTLVKQYERVDDPTRFDSATLARLLKLKERHEYERGIQETLREAAQMRYAALCDEHPVHAGTALGVFNAVCEVADHTRNGRNSGASIIGFRADEKLRAYAYLASLS